VATAPRLGFAHPRNGLVPWLRTGALVLGGITTVTILLVHLLRAAGDRARERARAESVRREQELARAFHESLAQDLAFIVTYTSTAVARGEGPELLDEVLAAARRSLDEVRRAIAVLSGGSREHV
jgi:signal transduction histidine kinase